MEESEEEFQSWLQERMQEQVDLLRSAWERSMLPVEVRPQELLCDQSDAPDSVQFLLRRNGSFEVLNLDRFGQVESVVLRPEVLAALKEQG